MKKLVVWKKAYLTQKNGKKVEFPAANECLVKLEIASDARVALLHNGMRDTYVVKDLPSKIGQDSYNYSEDLKCRADKAKVLSIHKLNGKRLKNSQARSSRTGQIGKQHNYVYYKVGRIVRPDRFLELANVVCGPGIHFFLKMERAVRYAL